MKLFCLIACLFLSFFSFSQTTDSLVCKKEDIKFTSDTVFAFIKGKEGKQYIRRKFFRRKFRVELSDKSYKIIRFHMVWSNARNGELYSRPNNGDMVWPDYNNDPSQKQYSLKNIHPGVLLAFEAIVIEKNGVCYYAKPFIAQILL